MIMRTITVFFIAVLFATFSYCQQIEELQLEMTIDATEWYTSRWSNGFYAIRVKIQGITNGQLITVQTVGDGLMGCKRVYPSEDGRFSDDVEILFHYKKLNPNKYSTYITAWEYAETPSEPVFCLTGSGEQVRIKIESDTLIFDP